MIGNPLFLTIIRMTAPFYYKWSGVHDKFIMPMDILVNKERNRIYPTIQDQTIKITKHSLIEILDREFYIKKALILEQKTP